ncbi:MAG: HAMP domain-containing sensor histidine kinase [Lachnospiraceae bacterium]|nr:HAMP domain-containing sensor histidine kinase [Lachnospiraceae bacterium]
MNEYLVCGALIGIGMICLGTGLGIMVYYAHSIQKMEKILTNYQEGGKESLDAIKETRESKLESRLQYVLAQVSWERERASEERDKVAALLSDLSHQLKLPLANVLMYTELLVDEGLSSQEREKFARETRIQARKMQWLIKDMLKASQLEQGILSFPVEYQGIKETIGKAVGSVYAQASDKGIAIVTEEFQNLKLYHNPKWTAQALGNILDNAVKYSPAGSSVTVRVRPLEIYTRIEIEDQGIGMEVSQYNEIFKRFYRGSQVEQEEGNGLGLYLAQLILNREKGYITVSSQVGSGSCFQIYLLNEVNTQIC